MSDSISRRTHSALTRRGTLYLTPSPIYFVFVLLVNAFWLTPIEINKCTRVKKSNLTPIELYCNPGVTLVFQRTALSISLDFS